jgi:hypothetical protein
MTRKLSQPSTAHTLLGALVPVVLVGLAVACGPQPGLNDPSPPDAPLEDDGGTSEQSSTNGSNPPQDRPVISDTAAPTNNTTPTSTTGGPGTSGGTSNGSSAGNSTTDPTQRAQCPLAPSEAASCFASRGCVLVGYVPASGVEQFFKVYSCAPDVTSPCCGNHVTVNEVTLNSGVLPQVMWSDPSQEVRFGGKPPNGGSHFSH